MFYTHGTWLVKPGREQEFVRTWEDLAGWTARETAASGATLLRDREEPRRFISFGPWPSLEEIEAWRSAPGFVERVGRIRELLESFEPRTLEVVLRVS
jgi:heme-degrading monooxygenase HmoA